jgi:hypothetical protein
LVDGGHRCVVPSMISIGINHPAHAFVLAGER